MPNPRIRQLVIACRTSEDIDTFTKVFGLDTPFVDPEVAGFGLTNAVFAIGDQFLEIVVPVSPSAPAQRFMNRYGPGGYMVIFQIDDLAETRNRCDAMGIRRVVNLDRDAISASHLHPADIGGAIISIDQATPPEGWPWAGPSWRDRSISGQIVGADLTSPEPALLAKRWADLLMCEMTPTATGQTVHLQDETIRVFKGETDQLTRFHLQLADVDAVLNRAADQGLTVRENTIHFSGVDFVLEEIAS